MRSASRLDMDAALAQGLDLGQQFRGRSLVDAHEGDGVGVVIGEAAIGTACCGGGEVADAVRCSKRSGRSA